jgi:hypothetical protein
MQWRVQEPLTSIGLVANRLLKIFMLKKIIPDMPLNSKLQSKKQITNGRHNTLKRKKKIQQQ